MELVVDFAQTEEKQKLYDQLRGCKPVRYRISIKQERDSVSKAQRGYYWAVVVPTLADFCGYEVEEMHEILKSMFNAERKYIELTGKWIKVVKSTEELDTAEYAHYLTRILRWAAQTLACYVPEPSKTIIQAI
ncbi:hypothetical protein GCM10027347_52380 [Larkinella harenae]